MTNVVHVLNMVEEICQLKQMISYICQPERIMKMISVLKQYQF